MISEATARAAIVLVLLAAVLAPAREARPAEPATAPTLTVTGAGSATARPDTGHIQAGVVTQASTAAQAIRANSEAMTRVLGRLGAAGIRDTDIRTTGLVVMPLRREVRNQRAEIAGYEVTNRVLVKVRDLDRLGVLVDQIVAEGANTLDSIGFSLGDPRPVLDVARERAVADARHRADLYARALGARLGRALKVEEAAPAGPIRPRATMAASAAVPIAPGEEEYSVMVTVTYALE
jgi:uncharacterized protein YggE